MRSRAPLAAVAAAVLASTPPVAPADAVPPGVRDARILHALGRLTWGPRPGDLEAVRARGLEAWIDVQLHPERIKDQAADRAVAGLETAGLTTPELIAGYEPPREARQALRLKRAELGDDASEEEIKRARRELARRYGSTMKGPPRLVVEELQEAKLLRAALSERQLHEVLVDFWMNHFNVYAGKGPVRLLLPEYERDTVRPRIWGRFEELLVATAESPAMLVYLDNWVSASPTAPAFRRAAWREPAGRLRSLFRRGAGDRLEVPSDDDLARRQRGLNENYARELMELHTLGVDGGYSQQDVREVARCFTGWTVRGLRQGRPEFAFVGGIHDPGDKVVLGHRIPAGGREEGRRVLHLLATRPATARFVSAKLVRRFVSDDPPSSLVERAARTFLATDGDLRAVLRTIVESAEFFEPEVRGTKVKTPLEFVLSAVRASGSRVGDARALAERLEAMGMPPYLQPAPTGYADGAADWLSTGGLLARLDFALDLAADRVSGVRWSGASAEALANAGSAPATARSTALEPDAAPDRRAALVLGSPEFQRR